MRKVHAVMQGKGGVGKTYIASLIAQYLIEQGEPVVCLDTDMVNATFRDLKALKVEPVDLFKPNSDEIDVNAMDGMVERFVTEDTNFVVDNGATSFVPPVSLLRAGRHRRDVGGRRAQAGHPFCDRWR